MHEPPPPRRRRRRSTACLCLFCESSAPTIAQSNSDRSVGQSVIGPSPLRFICWERILAKDSFGFNIELPTSYLGCRAGGHGEGLGTACRSAVPKTTIPRRRWAKTVLLVRTRCREFRCADRREPAGVSHKLVQGALFGLFIFNTLHLRLYFHVSVANVEVLNIKK